MFTTADNSLQKYDLLIQSKVADFWAYLEEELVPSLYQTKWYNEGTDPMVRHFRIKLTLIFTRLIPVPVPRREHRSCMPEKRARRKCSV